jgi:hypothetical protein
VAGLILVVNNLNLNLFVISKYNTVANTHNLVRKKVEEKEGSDEAKEI